MSYRLIAICGLLALGCAGVVAAQDAPTAVSRDENWKRCKGHDADMMIAGCTALVQSAQDTPTDLAVAHKNRANAYQAKQLYDLAVSDYEEAIKLDPKLVDAIASRGILLTAAGRYADAIPDFTRVIEMDPKISSFALYDRGLAYEGLGLDDLAIEDFSASIALEPREWRRFERRGTIYFRKGDYDRALADYEQALVINPVYAPALYARGVVKIKKGDAPGAGADFAAAMLLQDDVADVMTRAGVKP